MTKETIRQSLIKGRRTWNFKLLDDVWRKTEDMQAANQVYLGNLKQRAASVQFYVERYMPKEIQERFYDVLEDYAQAHDLMAIVEMRQAVKRNAFSPANDVKTEESAAAAAITISVRARYPNLKGKAFVRKVEEERERLLGREHRSINRATVHRHEQRSGERAPKRR